MSFSFKMHSEDFPIRLQFLDRHRKVVLETVIPAPGALYIPPLAKAYGPVGVRVTTNGHAPTETPPPGGWA